MTCIKASKKQLDKACEILRRADDLYHAYYAEYYGNRADVRKRVHDLLQEFTRVFSPTHVLSNDDHFPTHMHDILSTFVPIATTPFSINFDGLKIVVDSAEK